MQEQSWLSAFDRMPWRVFTNPSAGTVPAFAVMRMTGFDILNGEINFQIGQPNSSPQSVYLVNGPTDVHGNGHGLCTTLMQGGNLLVDLSSGTPAVGQIWGPRSGQWSAVLGNSGFVLGGTHKGSGVRAYAAAVQTKPQYGMSCPIGGTISSSSVLGSGLLGFGTTTGLIPGFSYSNSTGILSYDGAASTRVLNLVTATISPVGFTNSLSDALTGMMWVNAGVTSAFNADAATRYYVPAGSGVTVLLSCIGTTEGSPGGHSLALSYPMTVNPGDVFQIWANRRCGANDVAINGWWNILPLG